MKQQADKPHPLQNRVDPAGRICAVSARGLFMGNRGRLHDPATKTLLKRRWALKAWLICLTKFNDRKRCVMGNSYTELFFMDEVTALAAGHRPCFECQRQAAKAYQAAWQKVAHLVEPPRAAIMDAQLHEERLLGSDKRLHQIAKNSLPDGAIIEHEGVFHALKQTVLLTWDFEGYRQADIAFHDLPNTVSCLTPPASLQVLKAGYQPVWHPSAYLII